MTSFGVNDLYFTTTVTLKNTGSEPLNDVAYMRNVDPDQESPWGGSTTTHNFVKYQPGAVRPHPTYPNMALVIGKAQSWQQLVLGLGTVHDSAQVSHFGFTNDVVADAWDRTDWHGFSEASPRAADEGLNLVVKVPRIDPGASATFAWAYVMNQDDLILAMRSIQNLRIVQPSDTVSGSAASFAVDVVGASTDVNKVEFFISSNSASYNLGTVVVTSETEDGSLWALSFDSRTITTGVADYTFKAIATFVDGTTLEATKVVRIDNTGPVVKFDLEGILIQFPSTGVTTITARRDMDTVDAPAPDGVRFYREVLGELTALGTDTTEPYTADVEMSDLPIGFPVTIKAVAYSGEKEGVATIDGVVAEDGVVPTVSASASCRQHLDADPAAESGVYALTTSQGLVQVWCDMERSSDGGGWTVLYSATGADNEVPLTSDASVTQASPLEDDLVNYNLPHAFKGVFSSLASETLLWRSAESWIVVDAPVFGRGESTLDDSITRDFAVTLRSNTGEQARGRMGFSAQRSNTGRGGDFGLLLGQGRQFDGLGVNASMKNLGCLHQLVASHSPAEADGDHGYVAATSWSTWGATTPSGSTTCGADAEGGSLGFRVAVRDRPPLCPSGFRLVAEGRGGCVGVLHDVGRVTAGAAAAACASIPGGALVMVDSADTNAAVRGMVQGLEVAWLGLSDADVEGVALWPNAQAPTWWNWTDGVDTVEADPARDCTLMHAADGSWSPASCADATAYPVCSIPLCK